jgi:hypothetical protein
MYTIPLFVYIVYKDANIFVVFTDIIIFFNENNDKKSIMIYHDIRPELGEKVKILKTEKFALLLYK